MGLKLHHTVVPRDIRGTTVQTVHFTVDMSAILSMTRLHVGVIYHT